MLHRIRDFIKENKELNLILALSIFVCFWRIGSGTDQSIYPDEVFFDNYALRIIDYLRGNGISYNLDPPFYSVCLALVYVIYFATGLMTGFFHSSQDFLVHFATHRETFILLGRMVSASFMVLAVLMTYKTANILFEKRTAILASLGFTISYPMVWFAHTVHHTTISAFISILIVYQVCIVLRNPALKNYILTGVLIGIGIAVKLYPALFSLSLVAVHFHLYPVNRNENLKKLPKLAIAAFTAIIAASVFYPWPIVEYAQWKESIEYSGHFYSGGNWFENLKYVLWGKSDYYAITAAEPFSFWSNSLRILSETTLVLTGISVIFLLLKRPLYFLILCFPGLLFLSFHVIQGGQAMGARQFYFLLPSLYIVNAWLILTILDRLRKKSIISGLLFLSAVFAQPVYWIISYLIILNHPTTLQLGKNWLINHVEKGAYVLTNYAAPFNNISGWETESEGISEEITRQRKMLLPPFHLRHIPEDNFADEVNTFCKSGLPIYIALSDYNSSTAYYHYENARLWGLHKYHKFPRKYAFFNAVRNHSTLVKEIQSGNEKAIGPSVFIYKLNCTD